MSPVLTAPVEAPPGPPERPGYFAVASATFLGYLFTVLIALPFVLGAVLAGLSMVDTSDSVARGLFYRYDVWSWAAEACIGLLAVGATTLLVGNQLHARTGWEVPFGTTFGTLLLTGYAPLLALTPLYGATGIVSLGAAALVLRRFARPSGAEPMTPLGQVPRRYRRAVAITLAVAVPLMAIYAVGYGLTHPLRFDATFDGHKRVFARDPGAVVRYIFRLDNPGRAKVSGLEVTKVEGSPALQVERAGSVDWGRQTMLDHARLEPLADEDLKREGFRAFALDLRQGASCPTSVARLDALWVRYTVLGMRHEQRIPLVDGPSVRCR
jgi:hypothetical protein